MHYKSRVLLVAVVCLLPIAAAADISRISPQTISFADVESNLTIFGSDLSGTESTLVVFDGPNGPIAVEPLNTLPNDNPDAPPQYPGNELVVFIPAEVATVSGPYQITVRAKNFGEEERILGPATFTVNERDLNAPPLIAYTEFLFEEATSANGAVVNFDVTAQNQDGTAVDVSCSPAFGRSFPMGQTTVSCSASNEFGTSTAEIYVIVADTTNPVIVVPDDIVTTNAVVSYEVSAVDNIDGAVPVNCTPESGATFPDGITQVICTAMDSSFNVGVNSFKVELPGGLPVITMPPDVTVDSPDGGRVVVPWEATATNNASIFCDYFNGDEFYPGVTVVTCTATNFRGSDTGSFTVTVNDLTAPVPVITVPADITAEATGPNGAAVSFSVTATNGGIVACTPSSGSTFALGETTVNCTATNVNGSDSDSFKVTVVDTTAPTLSLPADITAEATGPNGAVVAFAAWGNDAVSGLFAAQCVPASGSVFAIGTTTVSCTATDAAGNSSAPGTFNVTVRDTTPPTLSLPANITKEATGAAGAVVTYTATASDIVDGNVAVQCSPASGSTFALGTTTVNCSATDARNNSSSGSFTVTVRDTTPPQIVKVEATPGVLWPPNHKMHNISVTIVAVDAVDPNPVSRIISVSSNQPVNGTGDGDTAPDWVITGARTLQLRAERSHGQDRTYTITVESVDAAGNRSTATDTVIVSQARRRAVH
jgi:HYR domain